MTVVCQMNTLHDIMDQGPPFQGDQPILPQVSGGFRGGAPSVRPPTDQNFFNFIGFFRKYYSNIG